jgi:DNA-binding XRE family transcriptional regulator
MEAVAQRVESSRNMQSLGQMMGNVVEVMGSAIETMDVEKVHSSSPSLKIAVKYSAHVMVDFCS